MNLLSNRTIAKLAGVSYLIIFFAAIFANFFVLENMKAEPIESIQQNDMLVRWGIIAFLITAVFDVVVAWALNELYKKNQLSSLSSIFRVIHASIMGVAVFTLLETLKMSSSDVILNQVDMFNNIWLIGLLFFGVHLILLSAILKKPKFIAFMLLLAGIMYIMDTSANFIMPNYNAYSDLFLVLVAIPSLIGEMSFAFWLLYKGGKD